MILLVISYEHWNVSLIWYFLWYVLCSLLLQNFLFFFLPNYNIHLDENVGTKKKLKNEESKSQSSVRKDEKKEDRLVF